MKIEDIGVILQHMNLKFESKAPAEDPEDARLRRLKERKVVCRDTYSARYDVWSLSYFSGIKTRFFLCRYSAEWCHRFVYGVGRLLCARENAFLN